MSERTDATLIGHPDRRLPGYALCCFEGHNGARIVEKLADRGIAVSSGSACHSDVPSAPSTLTAMGIDIETALGAVRFSMGRETVPEDVDATIDALVVVLDETGE